MPRLKAIMVLVAFLILLTSCGQRNPVAPEATNGSKLLFSEEKIDIDDEYIYRQTVSIGIPVSQGYLYAFQISTLNHTPLPGYDTDAEGWLLWGSDSIWSPKSSISMEFTSIEGILPDLITSVTARMKAPDGKIEEYESPFRSNRLISSLIEVPFADGASVSPGMEIGLRETIGDVCISGMNAHHFMYRLNILDADLQVIQAGSWHSSLSSPDIHEVRLSPNTVPSLSVNAPNTFTQFESYVVSRTGVIEANPQSVYFRVQSGFQPVAIIYPETIAGLGQYHYGMVEGSDTLHGSNPIPPQNEKMNRTLWKNGNAYEAINSSDFQLLLRWGYHGQYGATYTAGYTATDSPFDRELNQVLTADGTNYYSKINAFWLRMDGAPFPMLAQFLQSSVVSDNYGYQWRRVENLNDAARHCILQDMSHGLHTIQLKVEDLQGTLSPETSVNINLVPYLSPALRSGVLVIDASPANNSNSPEAVVDAFYYAVIPTSLGMVSQIDASSSYQMKISPATLQNYKAILWHNDNPGSFLLFTNQIDAMDIYLANQGNLVFSGTHRTATMFSDCYLFNPSCRNFLSTRFGINSPSDFGFVSNSIVNSPFFVSALGMQDYPDIPLNLTDGFNPLVNNRQGLSSVTFFEPSSWLDFIYAFGCKPVESTSYPPTQAQYDLYSSKYVAYRHEYGGGKVIVFGFPLSYMEEAPVAEALNSVFNGFFSPRGTK